MDPTFAQAHVNLGFRLKTFDESVAAYSTRAHTAVLHILQRRRCGFSSTVHCDRYKAAIALSPTLVEVSAATALSDRRTGVVLCVFCAACFGTHVFCCDRLPLLRSRPQVERSAPAVVWCLLHVACCLLHIVCCLLRVPCCLLRVACIMLAGLDQPRCCVLRTVRAIAAEHRPSARGRAALHDSTQSTFMYPAVPRVPACTPTTSRPPPCCCPLWRCATDSRWFR